MRRALLQRAPEEKSTDEDFELDEDDSIFVSYCFTTR